MKWDDLQLALAIAQAGSAAGAARVLGVAPSTVYRRLDALEADLGVRLFERIAAGWQPTEAGADLLGLATDIEDRIGEFQRRRSDADAQLTGTVRLTLSEGLAQPLARHLREFRRRYPAITVSLHVSPQRQSLLARDADVALRVTQHPPESLFGRRIAMLEFGVYGARALGVDPEALLRQDWVVFDDSAATSPQGRWEAANVPAERVALRVNSRLVFQEAVRQGVGVGVLPRSLASLDPTLVALGPLLPGLALPLWVLGHADLRDTARVRVLMDFLAQTVAAEL